MPISSVLDFLTRCRLHRINRVVEADDHAGVVTLTSSRGCRDLAERRGESLSPFIDAPAVLFTSWDRVHRSQPDCFPWLAGLESPTRSHAGERPALQILLCCFQQFAVVVLALRAASFGIPATAFWIYVCASLLFIIGLIKILNELPQEHGIDKFMPLGRLFFAISMAVFGSEHFTATSDIATLVPRWIPAHTFCVYLVGLGFLCAALSIAVLVQARLAATLVGMTLLIFVFVMDMPAVVAHP